jgi:hypothetical protein
MVVVDSVRPAHGGEPGHGYTGGYATDTCDGVWVGVCGGRWGPDDGELSGGGFGEGFGWEGFVSFVERRV